MLFAGLGQLNQRLFIIVTMPSFLTPSIILSLIKVNHWHVLFARISGIYIELGELGTLQINAGFGESPADIRLSPDFFPLFYSASPLIIITIYPGGIHDKI
jgi:hypothetical protein